MKKVLIITYYWPPAGGAGVQRVLKFAKYLPQFGWQPIILTVQNPDSPVEDTSLLGEVPNECKIYKTDSLEPIEIYKKFTGRKSNEKIPSNVIANSKNQSLADKISKWIRLNLFIPDAKVGWKYYAVKQAKKIVDSENIDVIFSTSPPPTVSLIAKKVAKISKLKWVADFRDPWMEIVHYQNMKRSTLTKFIDGKLEKSVLQYADTLVTISEEIKNLFISKIGSKRIELIPNGYDESDFLIKDDINNPKFTIAYTGVINNTRVPHVFLSSLSKFVNEERIHDIRIVLAGRACPEFDEAISKFNLNGIVENKGFIPHQESTRILQQSDMLLLVIDNVPKNKGFLTGKIFEYLGSKTPIFAIGPVNGDADKIIKDTDSGKLIDYNDEDGAYQLLKEMYYNWVENKKFYKYNVEQYSRKKQTEQLSKLFEELTK